jgi:FkbM family methyltransferase
MIDYSQNGVQPVVLEIFGHQPGRFLDIGANDGLLYSNTLALVERGWSGVLVEPSPWVFSALRARHGSNPRLVLVHAAVAVSYGLTRFWDSANRDGLSTTERANRDAREHEADFGAPFLVATVPVFELLSRLPGPLDFISIDTEGTSVDLLREFPLDTLRPRAVCVEHDGRVQECCEFAAAHGYRLALRTPENLVLVQ